MTEPINNEIRLMQMINHPFIARLYSAFQDQKAVYMALELLPGGDFFTFLHRAVKLTEDMAKFYASAVVAGLDAMHGLSIAYRDLKPENLVR